MDVVLLGAANPETIRQIHAAKACCATYNVIGFIDNDPTKKGKDFFGYPIFGGMEVVADLIKDGVFFVNLITGNTRTRYETSLCLANLGCMFTNLIHPSVNLSMVNIGVGNYIQDNVIIQADVEIGDNSSIHIGALVAHECRIGNSVFVAHASSLSGLVHVGDGTFIGTNATIVPRVKIGKWATVGAGAVVFKDVPDYATVVGNPARVVKVSDARYENGAIRAAQA